MSLYIRRVAGDRSDNYAHVGEGSWNLRELVSALEKWLDSETGNLPANSKWIADIGFSPRSDACGGGPILSTELMQKCIDIDMEIYFSEYTDDDDI